MFKIAILISLFAVAQVSVEKKKPIGVNKMQIIKKQAQEIALLCSTQKAKTRFKE